MYRLIAHQTNSIGKTMVEVYHCTETKNYKLTFVDANDKRTSILVDNTLLDYLIGILQDVKDMKNTFIYLE